MRRTRGAVEYADGKITKINFCTPSVMGILQEETTSLMALGIKAVVKEASKRQNWFMTCEGKHECEPKWMWTEQIMNVSIKIQIESLRSRNSLKVKWRVAPFLEVLMLVIFFQFTH